METGLRDAATAVEHALAAHGHARSALLQVLRAVQERTGWLAPEVLEQVAAGVGLTPAIVRGVAGFYRFLHLRPVGRTHVLFSDNVTDRHLGSRALAAELCRRLRVRPGEVRRDGAVSVGFTSCTGLGDQGPALLVDQHQVCTRMDALRIAELADLVDAGVPPAQWPAAWQRVEHAVRLPGPLLGAPVEPGAALAAVRARGAAATLQQWRASGLRGRGGAGFPTAAKLEAALAAPVPAAGTRVLVCNADEGEPGTFKDRVLLATRADDVLDGMTAAAVAIGARRGFIYLRGEYRFLLDGLQQALQRRRGAGLLGHAILGQPGWDFEIDIHLGAGAYVCGEESALIESLEGKRGNPRVRPPYPVERGYLGQPTAVLNVETLAALAWIARHGGAAWAALGLPGCTGTKLHAVSGDCARPGVYEMPFGCTVQALLDACGARDTQAVQVGGASGTTLQPAEFGRRIDGDALPTAGAFMVFDRSRDPFEVARGFSQFFAHESCGFCTPCRVGTELIVRRLDKLAAGWGSAIDAGELDELQALLHGTTHCGLGASAANPLRDLIVKFAPAMQRRLVQPRFVPAFDLDAELEPARRATGRDDPGAHLERLG